MVPYVEQGLDTRGVLGGLRYCKYIREASEVSATHHLELLGMRRCWLSQVEVAERHDAAHGLGRQVLVRSKLPPQKFPPLCLRLDHSPYDISTFAAMSRASQITLATTCFTAIGIVGFVHWSQKADKAVSVHFVIYECIQV